MSYKCPECGTILMYDYETSTEIIFYCIHCNKHIKAKKYIHTVEEIEELNKKQLDKAIGQLNYHGL